MQKLLLMIAIIGVMYAAAIQALPRDHKEKQDAK